MIRPKNILIASQAFPPRSGGKQTLMEALAAHSVSPKTQVTVYADGKKGDGAYDREQAKLYTIKRFGGIKALRQRRKAKAIAAYAARHKASSVFCDSWRSAEPLPDDLPCRVIVYAHGNEYPRESEAGFKGKVPRIKKALSKADILIAVSNDTKRRAQPFLPSTCRAQTVHNPASAALPFSQIDKAFVASLWPRKDKVRCLALCRLIDWKGLDKAIEAVAAQPKCQLVIAGDGDDFARLNALVQARGVQDRVVFAGRVEGGKKSALFDSADIFMQPGRSVGDQCEGYGITYIEAGLYGLPSLCGNQGGAPEAVIDGQTGLIIDGENQAAVTQALARLVDDVPLRQRLGAGAMQHAQSQLWLQKIDTILGLGRADARLSPRLAFHASHNYVGGQDSPAVSPRVKDERHD